MKLASLVLVIALALSCIAIGLSAMKIVETAPAGGFVSYGTWVSTFNILDGAVTSAKILNGTILSGDVASSAINSTHILDGTLVNSDFANAKVNLSGDTMSGALNMDTQNITKATNVTFGSGEAAYIYWNGTALIIKVS